MANDEIVRGFDTEKEDSLQIALNRVQGVKNGLELNLTGYIDTYNSNAFQKRVQRAIDAGFVRLIFNCKALNYVSSTGIGAFTAFLKTLKSKGGDLVLVALQPKVFEVFQLLGFAQFFNIRDTMQDARSKIAGESGAAAGAAGVFPLVCACPICNKKLKAVKAGRFRCPGCKTILRVDDAGQIFIG
jgi:anti-anti-sigma factor